MDQHKIAVLILFFSFYVSTEALRGSYHSPNVVAIPSKDVCNIHKPSKHSIVNCEDFESKRHCDYICDEGYMFPGGPTEISYTCFYKTGWTSIVDVPDCKGICNPLCQNNGECIENSCLCTADFRGNVCQYSVSLCDTKKISSTALFQCVHNTNQSICKFSCPQQTEPSSLPEEVYFCDITGQWTPSRAPECQPLNGPIGINDIVGIQYSEKNVYFQSLDSRDTTIVKDSYISSGVCATWGQFNYRTFDNFLYSFHSPCTYVLVQECKRNSFSIHVRNDPECITESLCMRRIYINIENKKYDLSAEDGNIFISREKKILQIPGSEDNLEFSMSNNFVIITSDYGFKLRWDAKETILVTVDSTLKNKTCGLCSQYDGTSANDWAKPSGEVVKDVIDFSNSWRVVQVYDSDEECNAIEQGHHVCKFQTKEERILFNKSKSYCEKIFENEIFTNCKIVITII